MNELTLQASQPAPGFDADAEKHSEHMENVSKGLQPEEEEESVTTLRLYTNPLNFCQPTDRTCP